MIPVALRRPGGTSARRAARPRRRTRTSGGRRIDPPDRPAAGDPPQLALELLDPLDELRRAARPGDVGVGRRGRRGSAPQRRGAGAGRRTRAAHGPAPRGRTRRRGSSRLPSSASRDRGRTRPRRCAAASSAGVRGGPTRASAGPLDDVAQLRRGPAMSARSQPRSPGLDRLDVGQRRGGQEVRPTGGQLARTEQPRRAPAASCGPAGAADRTPRTRFRRCAPSDPIVRSRPTGRTWSAFPPVPRTVGPPARRAPARKYHGYHTGQPATRSTRGRSTRGRSTRAGQPATRSTRGRSTRAGQPVAGRPRRPVRYARPMDGTAERPGRRLERAEILSIGTELTTGETRDTNAGELARWLTDRGRGRRPPDRPADRRGERRGGLRSGARARRPRCTRRAASGRPPTI